MQCGSMGRHNRHASDHNPCNNLCNQKRRSHCRMRYHKSVADSWFPRKEIESRFDFTFQVKESFPLHISCKKYISVLKKCHDVGQSCLVRCCLKILRNIDEFVWLIYIHKTESLLNSSIEGIDADINLCRTWIDGFTVPKMSTSS